MREGTELSLLRLMAVSAATLGLATTAEAQAPAHLDGTWTLNVARSDYGDFPGPNAETLQIKSDGAAIRMKVTSTVRRSTRSYELDLPADGSEVRFPLSGDIRVGTTILRSAKASWRGETMVVSETLQHMSEMTVLERAYTRSADGKSLTEASTPKDGRVQSTLVFDRTGG
jgi:hypothetical protein